MRCSGTVFLLALVSEAVARQGPSDANHFLNKWVVEVLGGHEVAKRVAKEQGFEFDGSVYLFEDHYFFRRSDHPDKPKTGSPHLTKALMSVEEVMWAEQQYAKLRELRELVQERSERDMAGYSNGPSSEQSQRCDTGEGKDNDCWLPSQSGCKSGCFTDTHLHEQAYIDAEMASDLVHHQPFSIVDADGAQCAGEIGLQANSSTCGMEETQGTNMMSVVHYFKTDHKSIDEALLD